MRCWRWVPPNPGRDIRRLQACRVTARLYPPECHLEPRAPVVTAMTLSAVEGVLLLLLRRLNAVYNNCVRQKTAHIAVDRVLVLANVETHTACGRQPLPAPILAGKIRERRDTPGE